MASSGPQQNRTRYEFYSPRLLPPVEFDEEENETEATVTATSDAPPQQSEESKHSTTDEKNKQPATTEEKRTDNDGYNLEERLAAQKKQYDERKAITEKARSKKENTTNQIPATLTPIFRVIHAIVRQESDVFEELIDRVDINQKAQMGWTALMWAMHKNRPQFLEKILAKRPDLSHRDKNQRTTLLIACENAYVRLECIRIFLEYKDLTSDDLNAFDKNGETALYKAARKGVFELIEMLLQKGADPNICHVDGTSPLMIACKAGHFPAVKCLLCPRYSNNEHNPYRVDISLTEHKRGRNALMLACAENRKEIVQFLLNEKIVYDPRPDIFDCIDYFNFKWNALMWSVYRGNEEIAYSLMKSKLPIKYWHLSHKQESVLDMCVGSRSYQLSKELIETIRENTHNVLEDCFLNAPLVKELHTPQDLVHLCLSFTY